MKKKYLGCCMILLLLLCSCQIFKKDNLNYKKSQWGNLTSNKDVYIELTNEPITTQAAEIGINIVNNTKIESYFGDGAFLEKKIDEKWCELAKIYNTLEIAYVLEPCDIMYWVVPLHAVDTFEIEQNDDSISKIELTTGMYRLVTSLYQDGDEKVLFKEFIVEE